MPEAGRPRTRLCKNCRAWEREGPRPGGAPNPWGICRRHPRAVRKQGEDWCEEYIKPAGVDHSLSAQDAAQKSEGKSSKTKKRKRHSSSTLATAVVDPKNSA